MQDLTFSVLMKLVTCGQNAVAIARQQLAELAA
jgi:hypothetical protein